MLTKDKLIEAIKDMPSTFTIDDLLDRLVLIQKIETGLAQSDAGNTFSTADAKERLGKWLK
jgi:uncharacterized membrane-anchored protein YjiN (DUF445 family)